MAENIHEKLLMAQSSSSKERTSRAASSAPLRTTSLRALIKNIGLTLLNSTWAKISACGLLHSRLHPWAHHERLWCLKNIGARSFAVGLPYGTTVVTRISETLILTRFNH